MLSFIEKIFNGTQLSSSFENGIHLIAVVILIAEQFSGEDFVATKIF